MWLDDWMDELNDVWLDGWNWMDGWVNGWDWMDG